MKHVLTHLKRVPAFIAERAAAPKPKHAKTEQPLLHTYMTSLLGLVLSVTMFLSTTYAWFSSSVTNANNEIYIGTLDVGLYKQEGDERLDLADSQHKLFDNTILWEPGYTALETVQIVNEGQLAFKYFLGFTDGLLADSQSLLLADVAACFDVWVFPHTDGVAPTATDYAAITAADSGWTHAGALDALLGGKSVLAGIMDPTQGVAEPVTDATYTIALHMKESAASIVMGHKISLSVKLTAYQQTAETDDFGNGNYDNMVVVTDTVGLVAAIDQANDGDVIAVAAGTYDLTATPLVIRKAITLRAADYTDMPTLLCATADSGTITHGVEILSDNVTVQNLILEADPAGNSSGNLLQISPNGDGYYSDVTIEGCTFRGSDHCIAMYGNDVTVRGCTLDGSQAADQGNLLYVWGTSGTLTVEDNHFIGREQNKHGISFYQQAAISGVTGHIVIKNNTFEDVYKAIVHESAMTYTNVSVEILGNTFRHCRKKPIAIDHGVFASYVVNENVFIDTTESGVLLDNKVSAVINADNNYWGSSSPVWNKVIYGSNVSVSTYYTNPDKTNTATNET